MAFSVTATQTRRPFFRRRKTCPFSGANAPKIDYKDVRLLAALRLRARQDRAEPDHGGVGQEAARARPGDQARALSRPVALRDPVTDARHEDRRQISEAAFPSSVLSRLSSDGWDGLDPSLTAEEAGQLDDADRPDRIRRGRGGGAAVCFGRLRIACGGLSVLSRAAADPDRRAGLEPHGRADRGGVGHRVGRNPLRRLLHRCARDRVRPAWWLGYLALLARPAANGGGGALEWYPVGRLVLWAAMIGTADRCRSPFPISALTRKALAGRLCARPTSASCATQALIDMLVVAVPPAAAVFSTITNVVQSLARRAHRENLRPAARPWPDLSALAFPAPAPALLAAAIAGSFLPGLVGISSGVFAASLLMAYAILGFAVLHTITRGMSGPHRHARRASMPPRSCSAGRSW